jgi:hypothetical protein
MDARKVTILEERAELLTRDPHEPTRIERALIHCIANDLPIPEELDGEKIRLSVLRAALQRAEEARTQLPQPHNGPSIWTHEGVREGRFQVFLWRQILRPEKIEKTVAGSLLFR